MDMEREEQDTGQEQFDSSDPGDAPTYGPSPPLQSGKPILPGPVAKSVSFGTGTVRGALRAAKFVGGYPFSAAKFTALTSIELGRHTFETVLGLAGRDVYARSRTDLGRAETYSAMARAFDVAHRGFTYLQLFTASGFDATGAGLATIADSFEFGLTLLDGFLGSTESSRALRSIGAFLIREFQNPATGMAGEKVGVVDLFCAFCSLVYLQANSRVLDEQENQRLGIEEIVWDVIVVNGERADVHNESLYGMHKGHYNNATGEVEIARDMSQESLEARLRRQIMESIPDDAKVSISTSTSTTITVDVAGSQPPRLDPPPGVELVEVGRVSQSPQKSDFDMPSDESDPDSSPTYRIVFRINRDEVRGSGPLSHADKPTGFIEPLDDGVDDEATTLNADDTTLGASDDHPPPVPPKMSPTALESKSAKSPTSLPRPTTPRSPTASSFPGQIPSKANQKKVRLPASSSSSKPLEKPQDLPPVPDKAVSSKATRMQSPPSSKLPEKKGGFRSAFKKGPVPSLSSLLRGDEAAASTPSLPTKAKQSNQASSQATASGKVPQKRGLESSLPIPGRISSLVPKREAPRPPQRVRTPLTARALDTYDQPADKAQSTAQRRSDGGNDRDSLISVTDSLSIQTLRSGQTTRPVTPTMARADPRNPALTISRSDRDLADYHLAPSPKMRRRSHVTTPSIYTLKTSDSQTSLMISPRRQRSAYNDADALDSLRRTGMVDGMFPRVPLLQSICKYIRFSSAAYGHGFLKAMGIAKYIPPRVDETHLEIHSFAYHTGLDTEDIVLTSFIDAQGGPDSTGSTNTGVPLVHYIALDHEAKAVVLACRGTLGFEDVLADMACEYDDLFWRGKTYKVHKGIHASARRLLYGGDGRVLATLKDALDRHPSYGLVLCGHSLGGAVTALLGVMLSEPSGHSHSFITSTSPHVRLLSDASTSTATSPICLPPSRPIHVFAYGPPGTMSSSLRAKTRGLITSVVQGHDLVPYLSLGVLHDFQAVALAFKTDNSSASAEFWQRLWQAFQGAMAQKWYNNMARPRAQDDEWAFAALKTLRASMLSRKLLPPGEVLTVETAGVLQRDAFVPEAGARASVVPARRVVLNYVRDVETRFREIRFGLAVLTDHSPGRYEDALNMLRHGEMYQV